MNQNDLLTTRDFQNNGSLSENFEIGEENFAVIRSFDELNLKPELRHGMAASGYHEPSPIQSRAILPAIEGRHVIAQAQSGTGKTATFVISVLQRINVDSAKTFQALVLSPTRELSKQTYDVFMSVGVKTPDLTVSLCVGGTRFNEEAEQLRKGTHVMVGTPGRVLHIITQRVIDLSQLKIFVLDEADEMLSRGFYEQIYQIYMKIPLEIQVMLLSATLPDESLEMTNKFMKDPFKILMKKEKLSLEGIRQYYVKSENDDQKLSIILDLFSNIKTSQVVIFASTQRLVTDISECLKKHDFTVLSIHSGMDQNERNENMKKFKTGGYRLLVGTDLIARGIDVQNVSVVFNFDVPNSLEIYLHRIGRSGRYGRVGTAINLVKDTEETQFLKSVEEFYNTKILELDDAIANSIH